MQHIPLSHRLVQRTAQLNYFLNICTRQPVTPARSNLISCALDSSRLLLLLTVVYLATYLPVYVLAVAKFHFTLADAGTRASVALLAHFLCYLNAAVNPFIYALLAPKFRRDFADMLTCRKKPQPPPSSGARFIQFYSLLFQNFLRKQRKS